MGNMLLNLIIKADESERTLEIFEAPDDIITIIASSLDDEDPFYQEFKVDKAQFLLMLDRLFINKP